MKKGKLSRRITWRVIMVILFFNVFIIGAIILFDMAVSLMDSKTRAQYILDGIEGKLETVVQVVRTTVFNNRNELESNLESPSKIFDTLERSLQVNKNLVGCFVALEPNYFKSQ